MDYWQRIQIMTDTKKKTRLSEYVKQQTKTEHAL